MMPKLRRFKRSPAVPPADPALCSSQCPTLDLDGDPSKIRFRAQKIKKEKEPLTTKVKEEEEEELDKPSRKSLEQSTRMILDLLQNKGTVSFKDIQVGLGLDPRRCYDIINLLMVLPCEGSSLVKIKKKSKKYKNAEYCLLDGKPLPVGDLDNLEHNIQEEQAAIKELAEKMALALFELELIRQHFPFQKEE